MEGITDEQLIEMIRAKGEKRNEAIGIIYSNKKFLNEVIGISKKYLENQDMMKEVLTDTFEIFIKKIDEKTLDMKSTIIFYLKYTFRNLCYNANRKEGRHRKTIDISDTVNEEKKLGIVAIETPESLMIESESGDEFILWENIKKLGTNCYKILSNLLEEKTVKETAQSLNFSEGGVKNARKRCKMKLIELIRQDPNAIEMIKRRMKNTNK